MADQAKPEPCRVCGSKASEWDEGISCSKGTCEMFDNPVSPRVWGILMAPLSPSREDEVRAEVWEEAERLSESWKPPCADTGHDPRWCGNCAAMETGIDLFGQMLGEKAKALRAAKKGEGK